MDFKIDRRSALKAGAALACRVRVACPGAGQAHAALRAVFSDKTFARA